MEDITAQVLQLMVSHVDLRNMARAMGEWLYENNMAATPEPMPRSTLEDYMARARVKLREIGREKLEDCIAEAKIRLRRIGAGALASKAYSAAAQTEAVLARIEGTEAAKVVHLGGPGGGPIPVKTILTSDEKRARAAELAAAVAARLAGIDAAAD